MQRHLVLPRTEVDGPGVRVAGVFLLGLAARTAAGVQNDGSRGRHHSSFSGRDAGETCTRVSFKPERAFSVIAHVRDWEHAETVNRRCPSGQLEALPPSGVHGPRVICE